MTLDNLVNPGPMPAWHLFDCRAKHTHASDPDCGCQCLHCSQGLKAQRKGWHGGLLPAHLHAQMLVSHPPLLAVLRTHNNGVPHACAPTYGRLETRCCKPHLIFSTAAMAPEKVGTLPGEQARPRSSTAASSLVTHSPALSPCTPAAALAPSNSTSCIQSRGNVGVARCTLLRPIAVSQQPARSFASAAKHTVCTCWMEPSVVGPASTRCTTAAMGPGAHHAGSLMRACPGHMLCRRS